MDTKASDILHDILPMPRAGNGKSALVLTALAIVAVLCFLFLIAAQQAQDQAREAGYAAGWNDGYDTGVQVCDPNAEFYEEYRE